MIRFHNLQTQLSCPSVFKGCTKIFTNNSSGKVIKLRWRNTRLHPFRSHSKLIKIRLILVLVLWSTNQNLDMILFRILFQYSDKNFCSVLLLSNKIKVHLGGNRINWLKAIAMCNQIPEPEKQCEFFFQIYEDFKEAVHYGTCKSHRLTGAYS